MVTYVCVPSPQGIDTEGSQFQCQSWIHSEDTVSGNENNQSTKQRLLLDYIHLLEGWRPRGRSHHLEGPLLLNAAKSRIKVPREVFFFLTFFLFIFLCFLHHAR